MIDIEYKPFLRFHITDLFNKIFDGKIQNLIKKILHNREQGAFVIGPEKMVSKKYNADFLVKLSTALTHLVGVPNFDAMHGKYYARFEVKNTDNSDSYLRKAAKIRSSYRRNLCKRKDRLAFNDEDEGGKF